MSGLSNLQKRFADEYLKCWNATEAARRAGYSATSENSLAAQGSRLLRSVKVANIIRKRLQASAMSADEVLERFAEQARNDGMHFIDGSGRIDFQLLKEAGKEHLIHKLYYDDDGILTRVEFYNAQSALNTLAKHLGLLDERSEITQVTLQIDHVLGALSPETRDRVKAILLRRLGEK